MTCPQCGYPDVTKSARNLVEGHYCPFCDTFFPVEPMHTMRVPDSIGHITGWRAWYLTNTPEGKMLTSQKYGGPKANDLWLPGQTLTARCMVGEPLYHTDKDGTIPHSKCSCGFYTARSREHLLSLNRYHRYDTNGKPTVIGLVHLWGKVRVGAQGWRSQFVKAAEIYVPYEMWQLANELAHYKDAGIPVHLDNTLVAPEREGPRWCKRCGMQVAPRAYKCECGTLVEGG